MPKLLRMEGRWLWPRVKTMNPSLKSGTSRRGNRLGGCWACGRFRVLSHCLPSGDGGKRDCSRFNQANRSLTNGQKVDWLGAPLDNFSDDGLRAILPAACSTAVYSSELQHLFFPYFPGWPKFGN